jgi:hypothetical protein
MVREWNSGGRLHTSMLDNEVVADGDPGEVLWLWGGYEVVRAELIQKRKHGCGAHRGGKWQRHFGALHQCTIFAKRGGRGVDELRCRTRPRNGRERWRALAAFDQEKKGEKGRGPARAAPHGGRRILVGLHTCRRIREEHFLFYECGLIRLR